MAIVADPEPRPQGDPAVEILTAVAPIEEEWEELSDLVAAPPFLRPGWIAAWLEAFGGGRPRVFAVRRGHELVGVLPMRVVRGRLRPAANWHTPQFGPVAVDEMAQARLLDAVFQQRNARVELSLLGVDPDWLVAARATARAAGRTALFREVVCSPYIALSGDFARYEEGLSRNRRKGLRRQRRRLEEQGPLRLEVATDRRGLNARLEEVFELEASGWKGQRGTAMASTDQTRAFYARVASWAADRGWLRLAFLRLGDRAIACDYALECDGVWYSLKAGYDEQLRHLGPGAVMLHAEVEHCFERGLSRLELLGAADPFKLSWTERCERRYALEAFRPTPMGLVGLATEATRDRLRPLRRRVRGRSNALGVYAAGATTSNCDMSPWSSWSSMWQCTTYLPV